MQSVRGVLDTTVCDKVYQWLVAGQWFSLGTQVSSTNKTDNHGITDILLKVALNNITLTPKWNCLVPLCKTLYCEMMEILLILRRQEISRHPVVMITILSVLDKLHHWILHFCVWDFPSLILHFYVLRFSQLNFTLLCLEIFPT